MYNIDFNKPLNVHFIGIGGISMSGFAELLHTIGFHISGSDVKMSKITNHLESLGINIVYGQREENITKNIDLIIYTAAIREDNPEYIAALNSKIPMLDRAEMVGQVMKNYKKAIAVAGTHGKTTTTSMISHILLAADLDPTISVGGMLKAIDGNIRVGKSPNFITEACEYTNSFLKFFPTISIILNIEAEHLDYFKDLDHVRESFHEFAKRLPQDGLLIINGEIDKLDALLNKLDCRIVTYGINSDNYDFCAKNITYTEFGLGQFDLYHKGNFVDHINMNVVGEHNISNALAAIALGYEYSISIDVIKKGIFSFKGTERRFEYKGSLNGINIVDDYAHHPTEIEATLSAAQKYPHDKLWCIFQPHTYTRTKAFLKDFAQALSNADKIVLTDIYAAREKDPGDISSQDLKHELQLLGKETYYFPEFNDVKEFLLKNCSNGDLLITMGAGDVVTIGESLLEG